MMIDNNCLLTFNKQLKGLSVPANRSRHQTTLRCFSLTGAVLSGQGVREGLCSPGWHIPSSAEWDQLLAFCNGPGQAGGPMKDTLQVNGFQSHQQGFLYINNTWAFTNGLTAGAMYWTSTAAGPKQAVARGLNEYNPSVSRYEAARENAFAVRCLKD
jgi:uncharacterized protein (TIGR02145 family)